MELAPHPRNDQDSHINSPSLRSFPLDTQSHHLPPISHSPKSVIAATQLGGNPYPNYRNASDFGSIGSIGELSASGISDFRSNHQEDTVQSFALTVCKQCQDVLLGAFDHCLNKHGEPLPLLSTHHIDEEADGKILIEPPSFDIVKDPTLSQPKKPAFDDPKEKIDRDRWVQQQAKLRAARLDISAPKVKGLGVKTGKAFSGAIYKRMLESKDREINQLRAQLYDTARKELVESDNVKKLKKALNQSVNYYTFAEEWQQNESSRLQQDVRHLKSEMSSLMAFLINSEVEKQSLIREMRDLKATITVREADAAKAIQQAEDMKSKLQESFKEFISMDEMMKVLRKEAIKGSESVEMRNNMLQKNLTKLTADFEVTNRDLKASTNKIRELEYELEQMVIDLNTKGEALSKSNGLAASLKETLEYTKHELSELQQIHEQLILLKAKVEAEGRADIAKVEQQRQELKKSLATVTHDLEQMTMAKVDLDTVVRTQKGEIEKLNGKITDLTADRENLSMMLEDSQNYAKREISRRDETIGELNNKVSKQEVQIKTISDRREQLMFEVTDLQNALEIETGNAARYLEELNNTKKSSEEKILSLTEQIEKLTAAKQLLNSDKKELTEKIKTLRLQLQHKQEELESTNKDWDEKYKTQSSTLSSTSIALEKLTREHQILNENHSILTENHKNSVAENKALKIQNEAAARKQSHTDNDLEVARSTLAVLIKEKTGLQWDLANAKTLHDQLQVKYNAEVTQHLISNESHARYKARTDEIISDREAEIQRHLDELVDLRKGNRVFIEKQYQLENTISELEGRLAESIKEHRSETRTRELLESQLNDNRLSFQNEKRMRTDLERVAVKLKYIETFRENDHMEYWKTRDRKLAQVTIGLTNESKRLNQLVDLLPSETRGGFGNEKDFKWPADIPFKK